jgi:hypothetical protein
LESVTIRAKYKVPIPEFAYVSENIEGMLKPQWHTTERIGSSITLVHLNREIDENWNKAIDSRRTGVPMILLVTVVEHQRESLLLEVECRPVLWYKINQRNQTEFSENSVQEAQIECSLLIKQVMGGLKGEEIEPVSVYPIIQRTEIKRRLLNLGLKETVEHLDKAERHIVQNNFEASLKSSRTAFEKMIDWEMKKRLGKTGTYHSDLERLKSKGFLDPLTTELIQTYYRCLSNIAVHAKGEVPPGFHEAQMGYGLTLIMLQYFADKLP